MVFMARRATEVATVAVTAVQRRFNEHAASQCEARRSDGRRAHPRRRSQPVTATARAVAPMPTDPGASRQTQLASAGFAHARPAVRPHRPPTPTHRCTRVSAQAAHAHVSRCGCGCGHGGTCMWRVYDAVHALPAAYFIFTCRCEFAHDVPV